MQNPVRVTQYCCLAGFLAANRIGPLKNDMDVDVTFEGESSIRAQHATPSQLLKRAQE